MGKAAVPKKKYIVFVGNLPFDLPKEELETFLADHKPLSVRYMYDRETKKPKGFAFVEFADSASLEGALALHQKKIRGRKINVELTAGGGGSKSELRRRRIREKNEKLEEERQGALQ